MIGHAQQGLGLVTKTEQPLILRLVLLYPIDGPVIPLPGLILLALSPVGHRQKEPRLGCSIGVHFRGSG